jgi:hypothetical protein
MRSGAWAVAVDRFAREIGPFLKLSCATRSLQLKRNPLDCLK